MGEIGVVVEPRLDDEARLYLLTADELSRTHFAPEASRLDELGEYARDNVEVLHRSGLAGMFVPRSHGGGGASVTATTAVLERIAMDCASTATILSTYLLGAYPIVAHGTDEQRDLVLRDLTERGAAVSFALTEAHAGSDISSITTTARSTATGFAITGEKWLIGNGGASRRYIVFARIDGESALSAFLVDADADGVVIDHIHRKMGIRGTLTSNLRLEGVEVSEDAMIGSAGQGGRVALGGLDVGRIAVAATALGLGLGAFATACERATTRQQFGKPLVDHQAIGFRLADIATELSAARLLVYEAARQADEGADITTVAAMAKLHASEVSHRAVDTAVQTFGGWGYVADYPVDRMYRDQRGYELAEGTSEIQRLVISRALSRRQWGGASDEREKGSCQ